jgi:uncharacterized Fe-S center protein
LTKSKVFYMGPRAPPSDVEKGQRLFEVAGLQECFTPGDRVAIKTHCGEWNNTGYLRPNIVAGIVETVKEYGGDPFVCDTTTLQYNSLGARTAAQDEYRCAARNGFTKATLGCPFIVADGDYGDDDVRVAVDGNVLKATYIASAIATADAVIVLSHFKGHSSGVYGGAIKNVGIGCCSKRGKSVTHLMRHPLYGVDAYGFHPETCLGAECPWYAVCAENCPVEAFQIAADPPYARWDRATCAECGGCWYRFRCGVLENPPGREVITPAAFADSAKAAISLIGAAHIGFITYAIDISPACDCASFSDMWMLPNLGVFASKDIVAIDKACLDASTRVAAIPGSRAFDEGIPATARQAGHDHFTYISTAPRYPEVSQWIQVNTAVNLGLGSADYELIEADPGPPEKYLLPELKAHPAGYRLRKKYKLKSPKPAPGCFQDTVKLSMDALTKPR